MNENKIKAVILARVSSKDQEETGYSLPSQGRFLKEYAEDPKRRFLITKSDVFSISESASGKSQRKKFTEMLDYVEKHNIKVIILEKVDRLTRNFKDMVAIDEWLDEDEERQVHLVKDSLILHKNSRSQEKLNWGIRVVFAKNYIDNLSEEVKKGQKEKIAQGWLPTKPPVGYKTIGEKGHKTHAVDEHKGPLMREAFELFATGNYSVRPLVKEMHKRGLRNNAGGRIGKSRMHQLLSDPFYYGAIRWNDALSRGCHEPLITKDLFGKVQVLLTRKLSSPQYRKHLPVFKAKIKCSECGGLITWEWQKKRWYGHCNHYRDCNQKVWTRQDRVEEQLFPLFDTVVPKDPGVLHWLEGALKEEHAEESATHKNKREEINRLIALADKRREKAYLDKLDGVMDSTLCQKVMDDSKKEKATLLEAMEGLEEDQTAYYEAGFAIHELAAQAQKIYQSPRATTEEKRLLLSYVFADMKLEEGITRPNYTYGFEFLSEWIPKLNKIFELQQNTRETLVSAGISPVNASAPSMELSELRNQFRTSKKLTVKARQRQTVPLSRPWLPG